MFLTIAALCSLCIWLYLLFARGRFWRLAPARDTPAAPARVAVVIPARDEAPFIAEAVRSLLLQEVQPVQVIVVDDGSSDGTASLAAAAARALRLEDRLTVLSGSPVPPGWTGKLWALAQGVEQARTLALDYLLFTDADIRHGRRSIAALAGVAQSGGYDLASHMVKLACASLPERALIPAFVFFFLMLYPPAWIQSPRRRTAGAAGGSILIRPAALERIGGLRAIRNCVIDDCALASAVKTTGGRVWLGLTAESESIRPYYGWGEISRMISRTAFTQLEHSPWLLIATLAGLALAYVVPVLAVASGSLQAAAPGLAAWLLMSAAYWPAIRFYRLNPLWCFCLPGIALFYAGATLNSAVSYWRGKGGNWKGRIQDVRPSRK